jgi:hypothetical protein
MIMRPFLVAPMAGSMLGACTAFDTRMVPKEEPEYVTGSHLMRRYPAPAASQMSRQDVEGLRRRSGRPSAKAVGP